MPRLDCDQSKFYGATKLHAQGVTALTNRDYEEANRLGKLGLSQIGTDYDPYVEALDDTGMHETLADIEEDKGNFNDAARGRLSVLEDRLSMYANTHQCRRQFWPAKPIEPS
jgi:hypothetical protein